MKARLICLPLTRQRNFFLFQVLRSSSAGSKHQNIDQKAKDGAKATQPSSAEEPRSLHDRILERTNRLWLSWERSPNQWKQKCTRLGNSIMQNIAHEEYALKSFPSLAFSHFQENYKRQLSEQPADSEEPMPQFDKVAVVTPAFASQSHIFASLERLAARQTFHHSRLKWSLLGLPVVAPLGLIPVLPNIPGFYLVYRAWSHWRALKGCRLLEFLLQNKLLDYQPLPKLDEIYKERQDAIPDLGPSTDESLLIDREGVGMVAQELDNDQLEVDGERALLQLSRKRTQPKGPNQ